MPPSQIFGEGKRQNKAEQQSERWLEYRKADNLAGVPFRRKGQLFQECRYEKPLQGIGRMDVATVADVHVETMEEKGCRHVNLVKLGIRNAKA